MRHEVLKKCVLLVFFVLASQFARAELDASAQAEITQLLDFVGHSPCGFLRNGKRYPASEARAHLQSKVDYLLNKNMVKNAEDFIELAGSKSSLSGKPYEVSCADGKQTSKSWLQAELERIRNGYHAKP
ncbi:DUF5329 domain-containing protein [Pseudomonas sp. 8O]|uniref:DUF5329 domain-containing protein n=1 Tax=Pseudomonas sp. 8O TaxID=2653165 RepID=UPI0012F172C3|nr:DUF5329 domain-containing protein [Pseudomonas sp. 8O]VXC53108.1 conserved exported hypothetical protein [Pseudomonas sp. 8O]